MTDHPSAERGLVAPASESQQADLSSAIRNFFPNPKLTFQNCEKVLDARRLQVLGHNGRWYNLRRNGQTKRWKTRPYRASIPVKLGLREAFRLEFDNQNGGCSMELRVRPEEQS